MNKEKKLFISHSSKDSLYVEQLIDIIENIGVPSDKIFCSSFEDYGIRLGEDFLARLKKELNHDVLVVFVLSNNFYASPISLCEMGATWMQTNEHIPMLIPPFDYESVKGVIPNTQGMKINDKNKMNSFKERLESFFSIESTSFSIWERKRDNSLKIIRSLLDNSSGTDNLESSKKVDSKSEIYSKNSKEYQANGYYFINGTSYFSIWTYKNRNSIEPNISTVNGRDTLRLIEKGAKWVLIKPDFGGYGSVKAFPVKDLEGFYGK
ncbi:MAG: toll/interleukin-1 receptor domain-containing protein [Crocinitomicaceae bacterium]